jgi:hypothetical protein
MKSLFKNRDICPIETRLLKECEEKYEVYTKEKKTFVLLVEENKHPPITLQSMEGKVIGVFDGIASRRRDDKGRPLPWAKKGLLNFGTFKTLIFTSSQPKFIPSFAMEFHKPFFKPGYFDVFEWDRYKLLGKVRGMMVSGPELSIEIKINLNGLHEPDIALVDKNKDLLGFSRQWIPSENFKLVKFGGPIKYTLLIDNSLEKEQRAVALATLITFKQEQFVEGFGPEGG